MILLNLLSFFAVATEQAVPGTRIPLQLQDYELKTFGWEPSSMRWELVDPNGITKYFVDSNKLSATFLRKEGDYWVYSISVDAGYVQIPAFAMQGDWKIKATFHEKPFFVLPGTHSITKTIDTIPVSTGSIFDSLNAPIYFILDLDFSPIGHWQHAYRIDFPVLVAIALLFIIFMIVILILRRR